jgi:hypothetical protein
MRLFGHNRFVQKYFCNPVFTLTEKGKQLEHSPTEE